MFFILIPAKQENNENYQCADDTTKDSANVLES